MIFWPCISVYLYFADRASQYTYILPTVHLSIFMICWPCISVYLYFADRAFQYIYDLLTVHSSIFMIFWPCISVHLYLADLASQDIYVLLTVHLSIFILVINQLDTQFFCFTISLFHDSTCFEHHVLIIRRSWCSKHVQAWNKLSVKQKIVPQVG